MYQLTTNQFSPGSVAVGWGGVLVGHQIRDRDVACSSLAR